MKKSYEAAIKSDNENYYLKLDYAFKLVEAGELQKAKQLLISYIPYDSLNPRLFATLAKINYWQGDYKTAYQYILKSITLDESTSETRELYNKIKEAKTPFVELNTDYSLDNQPLKTISPSLETHVFFNKYFIPNLSIQQQLFEYNQSTASYICKFGNKAIFPYFGITAKSQAGVIIFPDKKILPLGLFSIDKKILKHLTFNARMERKPYMYMLQSLDTTLLYNEVSTSINWNSETKGLAQLLYSRLIFPNNNYISTFSTWGVLPVFKIWKIQTIAGYSYNYTTSQKDTYAPLNPLNEINNEINYNSSISGEYKLYMTPKNQIIHRIIGIIIIKPNNSININLNLRYGFIASVNTPYLYGYYNQSQDIAIKREYFPQKYHPLDIQAKINIAISKQIGLQAEYQRSMPNFYYTNNYFGIGFKIKIL